MNVSFQAHPVLKQSFPFPLASQQQVDKFPDGAASAFFLRHELRQFFDVRHGIRDGSGQPHAGHWCEIDPIISKVGDFLPLEGHPFAHPIQNSTFVVGPAMILGHAKDFQPSHDTGHPPF